MDGIKVTKRELTALLRTLASAMATQQDTKAIQQKWLLLYIVALFKQRSSKTERHNYTQQQLIALLRERGVADANIADKTNYVRSHSYYYPKDDDLMTHFEVKFGSYRLSLNNYRGGNQSGSYRGVIARFWDHYQGADLGFMTAEQAAATLVELDTLIPQWIVQEWPSFMLEAQKMAKIRNINENTIETMLKTRLDGTGITYHAEKQKLRVKAYFNIGSGMQVEWFISHKNFVQQIDSVVKAVTLIKEAAEQGGSTFTAKAVDKNIDWQ